MDLTEQEKEVHRDFIFFILETPESKYKKRRDNLRKMYPHATQAKLTDMLFELCQAEYEEYKRDHLATIGESNLQRHEATRKSSSRHDGIQKPRPPRTTLVEPQRAVNVDRQSRVIGSGRKRSASPNRTTSIFSKRTRTSPAPNREDESGVHTHRQSQDQWSMQRESEQIMRSIERESTDFSSQTEELEKAVQESRAQYETSEKAVQTLKADKDKLEQEVRDLKSRNTLLEQTSAANEKSTQDLKKDLEAARKEVTTKETALEQMSKTLKESERASEEKLRDLRRERDRDHNQQSLQKSDETLGAKLGDLKDRNRDLEQSVKHLKSHNQDLKDRERDLKDRIRDLTKSEQDLKDHNQDLKDRIRDLTKSEQGLKDRNWDLEKERALQGQHSGHNALILPPHVHYAHNPAPEVARLSREVEDLRANKSQELDKRERAIAEQQRDLDHRQQLHENKVANKEAEFRRKEDDLEYRSQQSRNEHNAAMQRSQSHWPTTHTPAVTQRMIDDSQKLTESKMDLKGAEAKSEWKTSLLQTQFGVAMQHQQVSNELAGLNSRVQSIETQFSHGGDPMVVEPTAAQLSMKQAPLNAHTNVAAQKMLGSLTDAAFAIAKKFRENIDEWKRNHAQTIRSMHDTFKTTINAASENIGPAQISANGRMTTAFDRVASRLDIWFLDQQKLIASYEARFREVVDHFRGNENVFKGEPSIDVLRKDYESYLESTYEDYLREARTLNKELVTDLKPFLEIGQQHAHPECFASFRDYLTVVEKEANSGQLKITDGSR